MRRDGAAKRILGYARVSSEEQARGSSLQDQQAAIKAYADSRSLEVARFYVEAESAVYEKIERREQIRQLMRDVRAGDLVVCDKLDRWSRDPEFTYRSVREILSAGAGFYAVGDRCDPSTPDGDSMLGIRVYVAREEHKRIKERMVGTRKLLRNRGLYSEGLPPVGYERQLGRGAKGLHKNILRPAEKNAAIVRELFQLAANGWSISELLKRCLKHHAHRGWDKKSIGLVLRNRVYIGEVRNADGVWIKGQHEPIVTIEQFAKTQAALDSRRLGGARFSNNSRTKTWLLREIGRCALCGAKVSASYGETRNRPLDYSYYYRCAKRCGAKYVRVETVDAEVGALIVARLIELKEYLSGPEKKPARKMVDYSIARRRLQARRERYLDIYSDGLIGKDELRDKLSALDSDLLRVDADEAAQVRSAPLTSPQSRRKLLGQVEEIAKLWSKATPIRKRSIVHELALEVRIGKDLPPAPMWKTPEQLAEDDAEKRA